MRKHKSRSLRVVAAACIALALGASTPAARAQDYPARPVTLLVPLGAGGAMDIIVRSMAPKLSERLGKSVVVENRVGAGTVLAPTTSRTARRTATRC